MQKVEKILPYLFAVLLPAVNILSNYPFRPPRIPMSFEVIFPRVLLLMPFLFFIWKLNEWVIFGKPPFLSFHQRYAIKTRVIIANLGLISFFLVFELFIFPFEPILVYPGMLAIRMSMATILVSAILFGFKGIREREALKRSNLALQSENMLAQFEILKQQVNPHFLFNSLSTLRSMVRAQDPQAEEYLLNLSEVYREILKKREVYEISLKDELAFLKKYKSLLELRHGPALQVELQINPESLDKKLPTFALQLLLENCIKHNVVAEAHPLKVRIYQPSSDILCMENNLQIKKGNIDSQGLGLENLRKRYEFVNRPDGLVIEQDQETFRVCLALLTI